MSSPSRPPVLLGVMGPTASGKTEFAEALATELGAQLISADAFQAYRGFDIGTAKPSARARYELLDIKSPREPYGVGEFVTRCHVILNRCWEKGQSAVVVGGTGLYVRALFEEYDELAGSPSEDERRALQSRLELEGLAALTDELRTKDPELAAKTDMSNPRRVLRALERLRSAKLSLAPLPGFRKVKVGLERERTWLDQNILARTEIMVQNGWVQEVEALLAGGVRREDPAFQAIGYRAMADVVNGQIALEKAIATTIAETWGYAKRQRTWLNSEPRLIRLYEFAPDRLRTIRNELGLDVD